jgi:hypothetical protein
MFFMSLSSAQCFFLSIKNVLLTIFFLYPQGRLQPAVTVPGTEKLKCRSKRGQKPRFCSKDRKTIQAGLLVPSKALTASKIQTTAIARQ